MENAEAKHNSFEFKIKENKITFFERNGVYETTLFQKRNSHWLKNAIVPLFVLEQNQVIHPSEIVSINQISENQWKIELVNDLMKDFNITTTVETSDKFENWIHFVTIIQFLEEYRFSKFGPEIKVLLDQQTDFSRNGVVIHQPTRHTPPTDEWKSNDMPAATIWNPLTKIQTFFYVNFTTMDWMTPDTVERFSIYECGLDKNGFFGLIHRVPLSSPITIPKGFQLTFDFFISQEFREKQPTLWDVTDSLISKCFLLLPSRVPFPKKDLSWTRFAYGCIQDLMKENYCWIDKKAPKYFAYLMDEAEHIRRKAIGRTNIFETMTLLSLLPPWILYLQINPNENQEKHVKAASRTVEYFIDPNSKFFYNNIWYDPKDGHHILKPTEQSIGDSWYFFEPILRFGWLIRLLPLMKDNEIYYSSFNYMVKKSIKFVKKHRYEITAFYDPFTFKSLDEVLQDDPSRTQKLIETCGKNDIVWKRMAKNYACLGIFIYIMIQAYYLSQEVEFLEEAKNAARKMFNFSPDQLFWEPFELAYGIAGFAELARITKDYEFLSQAKKLLLNELRMFYWYDDNSFGWKNKRNNLGLPMACIGIRYPAMKENVESIYPWLIFIKITLLNGRGDLIPTGIMKILNLIRINSFYFFSNVLPEELIYPPRRKTPCPYIPFEDLEMLETPPHFSKSQEHSVKGQRTGTLGREIYGSGEVILLYLMFEALANCKNNEVLILNLDLFDFPLLKSFPPTVLHFILFNPFSTVRNCAVSFTSTNDKPFQLKIQSIWSPQNEQVLEITQEENKEGVNITLSANEALFIKLIPL